MTSRNKKYMMHKYWGKKPAGELREIIIQFSEIGDTLLDPFAGYGGFSSEAILLKRNVISNDLNPMSNFINRLLVSDSFDLKKFQQMLMEVEEKIIPIQEKWYNYEGQIVITALRTSKDKIIGLKIKEGKQIGELKNIDDNYLSSFESLETNYVIEEWFPTNRLITNSRISAKMDMLVSDLFPKRALACHAQLFKIINDFPECEEKELLKLAFTSNLANCSKLVPPIKSRGQMAQGSWMTGFYTGNTYLENNVFHYFMNRAHKILAGKMEFLKEINEQQFIGSIQITNEDAKQLSIKDKTIDLVFTDFPYGDSVPYFEQSIIWNSWLGNVVDYENEIVISDSKERDKNKEEFAKDIEKAIFEIHRVLKVNKHFIFTFHSLSGFEWAAISNSLIKAGFLVEDCKLLMQKTLSPRQLNRKNSIKGDLIVVCKKIKEPLGAGSVSDNQNEIIKEIFRKVLQSGAYHTNDVIVNFLKLFFKKRLIVNSENIFNLLTFVASYDGYGWKILN